MRRLVVLILLAAAVAAAADDAPRRRPDLDVLVPVDPHEHERLHFFDRKDHHSVPGTVTINGAPYACDLDAQTFKDRDQFVTHVRTAHGVPPERLSDLVVILNGRVHFVGE